MGEREARELRYTAFLSYSHKDAAAAQRLHRRLETYRLPRRLVGSMAAWGPVPSRLWPIFRDREELPAATDLSETVRQALAQSGSLIVLCSRHSVGSLWVAEEIATFRRLHPDRPILAAILDGDPPDCFPAALRAVDPDGTAHEPLATDLRREGDGSRIGLLKLIAGITGIGLDELVQRDATRRVRRVTAVTAGSVVAMLIMAALTIFALSARAEAESQRAEAEGLIEFMLTDLRERLRGVGRLDVLAAVNERALAYYGEQEELEDLGPNSLERRARILHAMGEDDAARRNLPAALTAFREAHRTTAEQLQRAPNEPTRIFAHSQSEYWIGYIDYLRQDYSAARRAFERYKGLTDQLIASNPRSADWLKEAAYAEGNLCTVLLEGNRDIPAALRSCIAALRRMEEAAQASGNMTEYNNDLANRHAYVADALRAAGYHHRALQHRRRQLSYVERELSEDAANTRLRAKRLWALRGIAHLEADLGRTASAVSHMSHVAQDLEGLVHGDPENAEWREELIEIRLELAQLR